MWGIADIFNRDIAKADCIAARLRDGEIQLNGVKVDIDLPCGALFNRVLHTIVQI